MNNFNTVTVTEEPIKKVKETLIPIKIDNKEQIICVPYLEKAQEAINNKDYNEAIKYYLANIENGDIVTYKLLADLYYRLAQGDYESEMILNAIKYYKLAIANGHISELLTLGDIYNFYDIIDINEEEIDKEIMQKLIGIPATKKMAYKIYLTIMQRPDTTLMDKLNAKEKIEEINRSSIKNTWDTNLVTRYNNPLNFGQLSTKITDNETLKEQGTAINRIRDQGNEIRVRNDIINMPINEVIGTNAETIELPIRLTTKGDSQNVHDSSVTKSVTQTINFLKRNIDKNIPDSVALKEIRDYILNGNHEYDEDVKNKAIKVLDVCEKNTIGLMSNNVTESEALKLVWSRIQHKDNSDRMNNLKDNLVKSLSDAIEGNIPVCTTGRVTHIVSALEAADAKADKMVIKPEWAVKEEVTTKISKIFNDTLESTNDETKKAYNNITNATVEDQEKVTTFMNETKDKIDKQIKKEYNNIISDDKLNVIINECIESVA